MNIAAGFEASLFLIIRKHILTFKAKDSLLSRFFTLKTSVYKLLTNTIAAWAKRNGKRIKEEHWRETVYV